MTLGRNGEQRAYIGIGAASLSQSSVWLFQDASRVLMR